MTDWKARYATGDTPWDKGAPAPPLLEWLDAGNHLPGDVLTPGCGFGHDVRALAAARAGARRVVGFDLSEEALTAAARRFPPVGREEYRAGDLFDLPADLRGAFDWVFEHTCFCAIDPARRSDYVHAAAGALRPGGKLLAIFYLDPWDHGEPRPPGGGPPFGASVPELNTLFFPHFELIEEHRPTRAYPGREGRELLRLYQKRPPAAA